MQPKPVSRKKILISGVVFFAIWFIPGYFYYSWESSLFKKEGVYVLGIVRHKDPDRNGSHYRGTYTFQGKEYATDFTGKALGFNVGSFFFVELASGHPARNEPLYREPVPRCLTLAGVPPDGWKILPSYCHNPCGRPVRFSDWKEYQFIKDNHLFVQLVHIYSFHGGCTLSKDSLYANVFKCFDATSGDTLMVFSPCTHSYDFANVDYPPNDYVDIKMGDLIRDHPPEMYTSLEDGDISRNYQYLVANIDHNLGHD